MNEISATYDFRAVEGRLKAFWEREHIYAFDLASTTAPYAIDAPPPTMSGRMHAGHAFSYSQQDFLARFHRMLGENVFYPFGTDDNGLPTEHLVEKMNNVQSTKMSRADFVALCKKTIDGLRADFIQDWKNVGISCEWSRTYSTISPSSIATSQHSFLDLYQKGFIYRKSAPTMWCVRCQTAIAQADLESIDLASTFNDITFSLLDGTPIVIATTRPELLAACVCVFVHPDDKRYASLVGKRLRVPLFGQEVPVFADASADPQKGTGVLMVCSYGDRFDVDAIARKKLSARVIFDRHGKLNALAGAYTGLSIKDARKKVLEDLRAAGLLVAQKQITHHVNVHDRCSTEIEFLATPQWFIDIMHHKKELLAAGKKIAWYPSSMFLRYKHWIAGLQWDWCISRQRHFGVPFPVWYERDTGNVIVASVDELPVDPLTTIPRHYTGDPNNLVAEADVMDTWATSSVSPQLALGWHAKDPLFAKLFPMNLRPQAHDIIRTWAFYTIVKAQYMHGTIPWKTITISGHLQDSRGRKMSKSLGNVVDPREVLSKYGADCFRFMAASSKLGEDLPFQEKDLVTGGKTVTKLWNAARFAFLHLAAYTPQKTIEQLHPLDAWLFACLHTTIKEATTAFQAHEYSKARSVVDGFFWHTLCDNYLEFVKHRLYVEQSGDAAARASAQYTLYHALLSCIKLYAPFMPFITEEIYQQFFLRFEHAKSIHVALWPVFDKQLVQKKYLTLGDLFCSTVAFVRSQKSARQLSLKAPLATLVCDKKLLVLRSDLAAVTSAQQIRAGILEVLF